MAEEENQDQEKAVRSKVAGCIAFMIIVLLLLGALDGIGKIFALIRTSKSAAIEQTQRQDNGCFVISNPVYLHYESSMWHHHFDPLDHETVKVCGALNNDTGEKNYFLLLSDYIFVSYRKRHRILNDSTIIRYTKKDTYQKISHEHEEGFITYVCDNLYFSMPDTTIALKPVNDTIQSFIYLDNINKSYIYHEQYYVISESQLRLLKQYKKGKVYCPLHIDGVDDLHRSIRSKQIRQLFERFSIVSQAL